MTVAAPAPPRVVALLGNPNCGKSTLFNRLTGLRQHVANYPGVTVERKEGTADAGGSPVQVLDLPGIRSLAPRSPDERIAVDVLLGRRAGTPRPDLAVVVLNALHPEVGLYLLLQVRDLGVPVVACLNVADEAEKAGIRIDLAALSRAARVPVLRTVATTGEGLEELKRAMGGAPAAAPAAELPVPVRRATSILRATWPAEASDLELAMVLLEGPQAEGVPSGVRRIVAEEADGLKRAGVDLSDLLMGSRQREVASIVAAAVARPAEVPSSRTRGLDRILTHPVYGYAIFVGLMALVFQAMFSWAAWPMDGIEAAFAWLGTAARGLPPGLLTDLLVDGVIAGVSSVVVFLPQIVLLFLFVGILEDSGYMSRAVLLLDRPLAAVGLSGRAFVPLLGSMACAVPGVMATRVIPDAKERLAAILVAPLMTCSARLPVYTCLIGAVIPDRKLGGIVSLAALVMLGLYLLGVLSALGLAWVLRKTRLRSSRSEFVVELPPYRWPSWRTTGMQLWHRTFAFLKRAGTVIVGISILLWFLSSFPRVPGATPAAQLEGSVVGKVGRAMEPAVAPLGWDWKAGIGVLTSFFSAREVFVSTMGTVYSVEEGGDAERSLQDRLRTELDGSGRRRWTVASGLSLLVFYVYAMLCSSTVVTVAREAGAWRWALLQLAFTWGLAYGAAWATFRLAIAAGWGA